MATYAPQSRWRFARGRGEKREVTRLPITPRVIYNDAEALRIALLGGCGVSALPDYLIGEDLRRGTLVELLPRHRLRAYAVHALFTERRHLRGAVRVFLDFLADAVRW